MTKAQANIMRKARKRRRIKRRIKNTVKAIAISAIAIIALSLDYPGLFGL